MALFLSVTILVAAGYGLTLLVFYPGVMTYDAKFVYEDIAKHTLGDWQSPVMTVLWATIDPIAPGSGSMFLLIASSYWIGFGFTGFRVSAQIDLACGARAHSCPGSPGFCFRRHHLARHAVRDNLAAGCSHSFRRRRLQ